MTEEKTKQNTNQNKKSATSVSKSASNSKSSNYVKKAPGKQKKTFKKKFDRSKKEGRRPEFEQKVIDIRRVTRVVAGGRRFSFRVTVIVGDMKGRVGVGTDKGLDIAISINKAVNQAKKNMIKINLTESMSIPQETFAKYNASKVMMRPSPGKGIVAGGPVRSVLQIAGITDVVTKLLSRSANKLNNSRAVLKALNNLSK